MSNRLQTGTSSDGQAVAIITTFIDLHAKSADQQPIFDIRTVHITEFKTPVELTAEQATNADIMSAAVLTANSMAHARTAQLVRDMGIGLTLPLVEASSTFQVDVAPMQSGK